AGDPPRARGRGGLARPAALDRGGDRDVRPTRPEPDAERSRQPGAQQGRQRDGRGPRPAGGPDGLTELTLPWQGQLMQRAIRLPILRIRRKLLRLLRALRLSLLPLLR